MLIIRPKAVNDIEQLVEYLDDNAPLNISDRFRTAIMDALDQIVAMPGVGSPRDVNASKLYGLRMYVVRSFRNYLIFYLPMGNGVDIVRVLHGAQDVSAILELDA